MSSTSSHCIVCQNPLTVFQRGDTPLTRCNSCGLVALHPVPSDAERAAYYAQGYALDTDIPQQEYAAEMRRWSRLPEQLKLVRDIQTYMPPPATILDIGCDRAAFLDEARRYGFSVVGIEPSESARRDAERIGIRVHPALKDMQEKVDVAVMWHSLEHVAHPPNLLRTVHELLSPKGILAVRVPDFSCFWSSVLQQHWVWFQPEHHSYHFSPQSLRAVMEHAGFELVQIRSQRANNVLTLRAAILAAKSFARYTSARHSLKRILSPYYQYLSGIEVYAIARKKTQA